MYFLLFMLSLSYVSYHTYYACKGTLPAWLDKRVYQLRNDQSIKDLTTKRWDTPVGGLSKTFYVSILLTSFIVLTYLIGWLNRSLDSIVVMAIVFMIAIAITYFLQRNFSRRIYYYRHKYPQGKKDAPLQPLS